MNLGCNLTKKVPFNSGKEQFIRSVPRQAGEKLEGVRSCPCFKLQACCPDISAPNIDLPFELSIKSLGIPRGHWELSLDN